MHCAPDFRECLDDFFRKVENTSAFHVEFRFDAILYHRINEVFGYLPLAAVVGEKIFCCHGGLSPDLRDLKQVACMDRPIPEVPQEGLICDLLWADPYMVRDFAFSQSN